MRCDAVRHTVVVVSADSESSQPVGEQAAFTSSHDVNTANADLIQRVARIEALMFGDTNEPKEMTVTQTAHKLGVTRRSVSGWASDGQIPGARKWRGQWFVPRAWVAEQLTLKNPITQEQDPR